MKRFVIAIVLAIFLGVFSFAYITINGQTYNAEIDNWIDNIEDTKIYIDKPELVKLIDKEVTNNTLYLSFKSLAPGTSFVNLIGNDDRTFLFNLYVHKNGVITYNAFLGKCTGGIVIPICLIIWLIYILYLMIDIYNKNKKENLYQYKNIAYLGIIIYLFFAIINLTIETFRYRNIIHVVEAIINSFGFLTFFTLPLAFIVSILVIISNMVLIKKEGFSIKNLLGLIIGATICFATILPEILYRLLYSASWINIHNQNGWGVYVYDFVETMIYVFVSYIECVLLATIIIAINSARHVPKFDKDFIIILGCQIKKDGTLTNLLKGRVNRAIEFAKMQKEANGKEIVFVPSGGKGKDEVMPEAEAIKNYLLEQGIDKEKIIVEDKSKNTYENIKNSYNLIKDINNGAQIAFSTTNYHVLRAGSIATEQGFLMEGIGSKTKSYFWINAFIREFVATLYSEKNKHIIALLCILLFIAGIIFVTYINNNL